MLFTATRNRWLILIAAASAWLLFTTLAPPAFQACLGEQKAAQSTQFADKTALNYLKSTAWSVLVRKGCFVFALKTRVHSFANEDRFSAVVILIIAFLASYMWLTRRGPRATLEQARSHSFFVATFAMTLCFSELFMRVFMNFGESFSNVDPLFYFSSFMASRRFGDAFDLQTMALGQGFGSFQHPTLFNAFWWVFAWSDSVQVAYIFTEIAVVICVLAFAFWLSRNLLVAIASGFLTAVVFFVPQYYADHFGTAMPQHILQIALCYLALALIGSRRPLSMAAGTVVLCYVAAMDWMYLIFTLPLLCAGLAALCLTMVADGWRKNLAALVATVMVGVAFAAFLYLSGIMAAHDGFTLMAARAWGPSGSEFRRSLEIFGGLVGLTYAYVVGALSIVAMIYFIAMDRGYAFFFSLLILAALAVLVALDLDASGTDMYWTLPSVGYFERPFIPFYVVVIVYAAVQCIQRCLAATRLWPPLGVPANTRWTIFRCAMAASTASGIAALLLVPWLRVDFGGVAKMVQRPPYFWERTKDFIATLPFHKEPGRGFQPYFNDNTKNWSINNCVHLYRDSWDSAVRYCGLMLNITSVPNFIEFQNLLDLQTAKLFEQATLFSGATAGDAATGAFIRLKSLGIRYVAEEGTIAGAVQTRVLGGQPVSFIDLGPITPDDLSVRSLIFDPVYRADEVMPARERQVAVVHDQALYRTGPLAPATRFEMTYRPGGVSIEVASDGDSVILLPFQFSHCLQISEPHSADVDLIMVDGGQAALRFSRQARVVLANTLRYFGDAGCRRKDFISVFRHGIWPVNTIDELAQGRRIPFVMRKYLEARFRYRDQIMRSAAGP